MDEIEEEMAKPITRKEFNELKVIMHDKFNAMDAKFNTIDANIEEMKKMIKSQNTGVQLLGDLTPAPGGGVVDENGDQMFMHRLTAAVKRHKGGGLFLCVVMTDMNKKPIIRHWKYE